MLAPSGRDRAGFRPLDLSKLVYCGIRDFEPGQREKVERHGIRAIDGSTGRTPDFAAALDVALAGLPGCVVVHLDLDCLDVSVGRANGFAAPGGLDADALAACMARVGARAGPAALTIASFDPDLPGSDAIAAAGIAAARTIVQSIG